MLQGTLWECITRQLSAPCDNVAKSAQLSVEDGQQDARVGSRTVAHPAAPVVHPYWPEPNSRDIRSVSVSSVTADVLQGSVEERIIEVGRHRRAGGRLGGGAPGGDQERIRGNSFWYGADEYYMAPVQPDVRPCRQPLCLPYSTLPYHTAWLHG